MNLFKTIDNSIDRIIRNTRWMQSADRWIKIKLKQYRFRQARQMADNLHKSDGRRYIVVEIDNQFLVMNNRDRKALNKRVPKPQRMSFAQLMMYRSYSTN